MDMEMVTKLMKNLEEDALMEIIQDFIKSNPAADDGKQILDACKKGVVSVGELFENGTYYVGDVILASELLKEIVELLTPITGEFNVNPGEIMLGNIYGTTKAEGSTIFKKIISEAGYKIKVQLRNVNSELKNI